MIITDIRDYYEIHESLEVLNEGKIWDWVKNKVRRILGNYSSQLDELVAPEIIDRAINSKTGQFDKSLFDVSKIADTEVSANEIFDALASKITSGKYIKTGLSYLREYVEKADAEFAANVAKNVLDKEKPTNDAQEDISAKSAQSLGIRSKEYSDAFKKKYQHLNSMIEKEISNFIAKANTNKDQKFANVVQIRYNNAKSFLLLLEYEIKKKRWNLDDLQELTKEMSEAYKKAVTMSKDLAADIGTKKEEIKTQSVDKFKKIATENYAIGDVVNLKTTTGGKAKAEIKDFGETEITVLPSGGNKTKNIGYEEFNRWLIRDTAKK